MLSYRCPEVLGAYDLYSQFTGVSVFILGLLILLWLPIFSSSYSQVGFYRLEVYAILFILLVACISVVCSVSLIVTILSMEVIAFCSYMLVAGKLTLRGACGGWIYAVSGGLVSFFAMAGTVLLVSCAGSASYGVIGYYMLHISELGSFVGSPSPVVGLLFVMFGFLFKLSAAPYHSWTPDVYAATPVGILVMFVTIVKFSVFVAFVRLMLFSFLPVFDSYCFPLILFTGCLSAIIGSICGLWQAQIKRVLAYSSIAHMGFVLVGLSFLSVGGLVPAVSYMLIYVFTSLGMFAVMAITFRDAYVNSSLVYISDLSVLRFRYPSIAVCMVVLIFSQLGLPPFVGFFAKYSVLQVVVASGNLSVALVLVFSATVGAVYYLRLVQLIVFSGERVVGRSKLQDTRSSFNLGRFLYLRSRLSVTSSQQEYAAWMRIRLVALASIYLLFISIILPFIPVPMFEQCGLVVSYLSSLRRSCIVLGQLSLIAGYFSVLALSHRRISDSDRISMLFVHRYTMRVAACLALAANVLFVVFGGALFIFIYPYSDVLLSVLMYGSIMYI